MHAVTWSPSSHLHTTKHQPTLPYYALNQINLAVIRSKTNMKRYLSSAPAVVDCSSRITIVNNSKNTDKERYEAYETTGQCLTYTDHLLLYFNNNKQHCIVNTTHDTERTTYRLVITNDARKRLEAEGSGARGAVPSTQSWNAARPFSREGTRMLQTRLRLGSRDSDPS